MPKTFVTGDPLAATDLNTNMVQPGTVGTGTRIVAGKLVATAAGASTHTGTISFGFTFTAAPTVVATCQNGFGAGVAVDFTSAPTTTGVAYRITARDTGDALSGSYTIHWHAIGSG